MTMGMAVAATIAAQGCAFDDSSLDAKPFRLDGGADATVGDAAQVNEAGQVVGLCSRVGDVAGVTKIASDSITTLSQDCRIGPYFTTLSANDSKHLSDCFAIYLQATFACSGVTYAGSKDSAGNDCRSMRTAHQGLGITADDNTAFQQDMVAAMKANGMQQTDITAVISAFNGVQGVYSAQRKGNPQCVSCDPSSGLTCIPVPTVDAGTPTTDAGDDASDAALADDTGGGTDSGGGVDAATPPVDASMDDAAVADAAGE
jgi:hypothetical protein